MSNLQWKKTTQNEDFQEWEARVPRFIFTITWTQPDAEERALGERGKHPWQWSFRETQDHKGKWGYASNMEDAKNRCQALVSSLRHGAENLPSISKKPQQIFKNSRERTMTRLTEVFLVSRDPFRKAYVKEAAAKMSPEIEKLIDQTAQDMDEGPRVNDWPPEKYQEYFKEYLREFVQKIAQIQR